MLTLINKNLCNLCDSTHTEALFEIIVLAIYYTFCLRKYMLYIKSIIILLLYKYLTTNFNIYTQTDPLHSYLGLCGLSLNGEPDLSLVNAPLNITQRAADWLKHIHSM